MTFEDWLKEQIERDDSVGDLARDWRDDEYPIPLTRKYLESKNADPVVIKVLNQAFKQYSKVYDPE